MKVAAITKIGSLKDPDPSKRGRVELIDYPEQEVGPEDVKIRVAYCSICGSDPHVAEGIFGTDVPIGLGHEVSGVVEALGEKATKKGLKVGDRVAANFLRFCGTCYYCQNGQQQFCEHTDEYHRPGMAEYVVWHESQVYKLPDNVSLKEGCLLEPTAIAVRAMDKMGHKVGSRVAICGGGPIGQLALQMVKMYGATYLTMIEPVAERREIALSFGAEYVIDPATQDVVEEAMRITGGLGFDVVLDASGAPAAVGNLPRITAKGGTLLYGAMYPGDFTMPLNLFKYCYFNELTISGFYVAPYAFPRALQLLPRLNLKPFTAKVVPLERVAEAYDVHMSSKYLKVLVQCNEGLE
ncbi:MAG: alcohol dehydrogenase catalytic domain-containing protein [Firmicutes bacterium]|nr:alcohol dehydrogenase catalytic domain-containing protein [Bacillota bacterium]